MKITITAEGGSPVTLADHGLTSPAGLSLDRQFSEQIQHYLRARSARPIDRGNMLLQINFAVSIGHATITAAQVYWFDRHLIVPTSGSVVIEFEDGQTCRAMPNSTLQLSIDPPIGIRTTERFAIKSGIGYQALRVYDSEGNPVFDSEQNPVFGLEEIV